MRAGVHLQVSKEEMFSPQRPTLRELAVQALSSIEHGYYLRSPKFDATPFGTPDHLLDTVAETIRPLGPFRSGPMCAVVPEPGSVCCGTL
jgi:hypothetical protein